MNKAQNAALMRAGILGNTTRVWTEWAQWVRTIASGAVPHWVSVRSLKAGGAFKHKVRPEDITEQLMRHAYLHETCPEEHITIHAEVGEYRNRCYVTWSPFRGSQREAFRFYPRYAEGCSPLMLRDAMDAPSYENLLTLLEVWPEHVVELTCFDCGVGVLGWNTIFWEVRDY